MEKWILAFIYSFGLNFIWENLHSFLYTHKNTPHTEIDLLRAAIIDAAILFVLIWLLRQLPAPWQRPSLIFFAGVIIAVIIERIALTNGLWGYTALMPKIPFLNIGLSPTIQLGLTGYFVYKLVFRNTHFL